MQVDAVITAAADDVAIGSTAARIVLGAAIVATGLTTGVLSLYAHTIMPGLRRVDDRTFVGAFQAIDRAIINPWFMSCFFGALVLTGASALMHLGSGERSLLPWLLVAFVLCLSTVVITVVIHLPLNDEIKGAGTPDRIPDLAGVRSKFRESRWATWNAVRTLTSLAALVFLLVAVLQRH
jgi:uncharacterized membrane protein